jgi:acetyl-CoA C-acetyltransferase
VRCEEAIKDRLAIIGLGCTRLTEHFDKSGVDLTIDASYEAFEDAKVDPKDISAAWVGTMYSGSTGQMLTKPVKDFQYKPVTHVDSSDMWLPAQQLHSRKRPLVGRPNALGCGQLG